VTHASVACAAGEDVGVKVSCVRLDAKKEDWKQEVLWFLASSADPFANHRGDVYIFEKLEGARMRIDSRN
jgi:hypothetical protein